MNTVTFGNIEELFEAGMYEPAVLSAAQELLIALAEKDGKFLSVARLVQNLAAAAVESGIAVTVEHVFGEGAWNRIVDVQIDSELAEMLSND